MVYLEKEFKELTAKQVELSYSLASAGINIPWDLQRENSRVTNRINEIESMLGKKTKYPSYLGVQKKFI